MYDFIAYHSFLSSGISSLKRNKAPLPLNWDLNISAQQKIEESIGTYKI
jgi:hypothetical protein